MFSALSNPQADTCSQMHSDNVELVEEQGNGVRICNVPEGNSYLPTRPVLERLIGCELWNL